MISDRIITSHNIHLQKLKKTMPIVVDVSLEVERDILKMFWTFSLQSTVPEKLSIVFEGKRH